MKFVYQLTLACCISLGLLTVPSGFAEGGGGLDCPTSIGVYSYIEGSTTYNVNPFEQGDLGILYCEYETESEEEDIEPFGEITAVYHISGDLSQELIDEYGCGAILGEQYSSTYVSSTNYFASVAFSTAPLLEAAADIMTQIEEQNLATICTPEITGDSNGGSTAESVKEAVEEHEVIEDTSIEVSNEEIDEETIEIIVKEIAEQTLKEKQMNTPPKDPAVLLPNWIKNNAEWWSSDQISDEDFANGIEFMINKGHIKVPPTEAISQTSDEIPGWVKKNAGWWSEGMITDIEFVNGLQFLISNGIISVA